MIERDELLEQFLIEGRELVVRAHGELAALARGEHALIDDLFRTIHTLKGSVGLFDLPDLGALLHETESTLENDRRDGRLDPAHGDATVRALDLTEAWLDELDRGGDAPPALVRRTREAMAGAKDVIVASSPTDGPTPGWAEDLLEGLGDERTVAFRYTPSAEVYFRGDDPLALVHGTPGLLRLRIVAPEAGPNYDPFRCALVVMGASSEPLATVRDAFRLVLDEVELVEVQPRVSVAASAAGAVRTLRVDAARLDDLAALVDELVIAKNALVHEDRQMSGRSAANARAALERVVNALHGAVTDLRLVPLSQIFSRFPRQVREIADGLGKTVNFTTAGEQVALDKGVVDALFEPVLHLIRNAVDHGVEAPEARRLSGKPAQADVSLRAFARGDEVVLELSDDGRGIDPDRVRAAAIERGFLTDAAAQALTEDEAVALIFSAGFSTAGQVTHLSGRGVGMDAVRSAVERLGGRIGLGNRPGEGLTVRLILPAHVMLTKVLVVKAGDARYGVPLEAIAETHRVRREEVTPIRVGRAFVRRDRVIPILRLNDLLGEATEADPVTFPVLNVEIGGEPIGIQIGELCERVEAPLRPAAGMLSGYPGVLGTILRGDGEVLLVLDLAELAA